MTGLDLKLKRIAADVKAKDIAHVLNVGESQVSRWEAQRTDVTPEAERRYLDALSTCTTKTTDGRSAA